MGSRNVNVREAPVAIVIVRCGMLLYEFVQQM